MALPELTERQREIFDFLVSEVDEKQRPPSVREVGAHFGIKSPNGVMCHLRALAKKGYLVEAEDAQARRYSVAKAFTAQGRYAAALDEIRRLAWLKDIPHAASGSWAGWDTTLRQIRNLLGTDNDDIG